MALNEFLYEVYEQMDITDDVELLNALYVVSERIKKQLGIETPSCSQYGQHEADLFFNS